MSLTIKLRDNNRLIFTGAKPTKYVGTRFNTTDVNDLLMLGSLRFLYYILLNVETGQWPLRD